MVMTMAKTKAARNGGRRSGGSTTRRAGAQRQASATGRQTAGRRQASSRSASSRGGTSRGKSSRGRQSSSSRHASSGRNNGSRSPSAVRLLKQDHQEVSKLLERFEEAEGGEKTQIAQRICQALTVHAQIEEELLYPAAREALEDDDRELVAEANVEHASIKDLVGQIESARGSDELFDAKVKVLGEYVKHHVKEEETELFPKLQKTELDLEALGEQLASRKAELSSSMGIEQSDGMESEETDEESELTPRRSGGNRSSNRPTAARSS